MTTVQKLVKYLAIAFAIFLSVTIVSAILGGIFLAVNVFDLVDGKDRPVLSEDIKVIAQTSDSVVEEFNPNLINIEISATELEIKLGEKFKIESNNPEIKFSESDYSTINIIENAENKIWFMGNSFDSKVIVYLPQNIEGYKKLKIKNGAGKITINQLAVKEFELEQGAGKVEISNIIVLDNAKIDGGAGAIDIKSGRINNLKLNQGLGKTSIKADLVGNTEIDSGIGALYLDLENAKEDYRFSIKKGIGKVTINGEKIDSDFILGSGENYIKIEGGIGAIEIKTK